MIHWHTFERDAFGTHDLALTIWFATRCVEYFDHGSILMVQVLETKTHGTLVLLGAELNIGIARVNNRFSKDCCITKAHYNGLNDIFVGANGLSAIIVENDSRPKDVCNWFTTKSELQFWRSVTT